MLRFGWLIGCLAGCDALFGLERDTPLLDEDGDLRGDADDPCPHLADESTIDADKDGVSSACDPDDNNDQTRVTFYAFDDTFPGTGITFTGAGTQEAEFPGTATLGAIEGGGLTTIVTKDMIHSTAIIDVGFEMLGSSREDLDEGPWSELGLHTVHRAFTTDLTERGDTCFYGIGLDPTRPVYLEVNEDEQSQGSSVMAAGPLKGTRGNIRMMRTPLRVDCTVTREGLDALFNGFVPTKLMDEVGEMALSFDAVKVRLRYVYLAHQPGTARVTRP